MAWEKNMPFFNQTIFFFFFHFCLFAWLTYLLYKWLYWIMLVYFLCFQQLLHFVYFHVSYQKLKIFVLKIYAKMILMTWYICMLFYNLYLSKEMKKYPQLLLATFQHFLWYLLLVLEWTFLLCPGEGRLPNLSYRIFAIKAVVHTINSLNNRLTQL